MGCRLYWVRPRLGGCSLPEPGDERRLSRLGVTLLVSLVESGEFFEAWPGGEGEFLAAMEEAGVRVLRLPTPDFGAPEPGEACRAYHVVRRELESGGRVVAHCYGGIGRTGTFLAGYLAWSEGLDPGEAIGEVGAHGAGPQSGEQELFVYLIVESCPRGASRP
ncbi:MAG: hypothetical protein GSR80_000820 [Desulfurococcales archaeon]|nr:hypothetical protein [Desulfurococcales archaeon]